MRAVNRRVLSAVGKQDRLWHLLAQRAALDARRAKLLHLRRKQNKHNINTQNNNGEVYNEV